MVLSLDQFRIQFDKSELVDTIFSSDGMCSDESIKDSCIPDVVNCPQELKNCIGNDECEPQFNMKSNISDDEILSCFVDKLMQDSTKKYNSTSVDASSTTPAVQAPEHIKSTNEDKSNVDVRNIKHMGEIFSSELSIASATSKTKRPCTNINIVNTKSK